MKTSALALALALSTAGTAALADNTVALSYGSFEKNDLTTSGLVYDVEGTFRGFDYEGYVFDGDTENVDTKLAGAKLAWTGVTFQGFGVGPSLAYNYASLAGESIEGGAAGIAAKGMFGRSEVKADALVSFDDKEVWAVGLRGETMISRNTTLLSDYAYIKDDSDESQILALGARYDLTPSSFVEAQALAEHSFSETGYGARMGVGFRF